MLEMRTVVHLQLTEVNEKSEWTKAEKRIKELPQKHEWKTLDIFWLKSGNVRKVCIDSSLVRFTLL